MNWLQFDPETAGDMPKVVISGNYFGRKTMPSLNDLLAAYGKKPSIGSAMKKKYQKICSWEIREQLNGWKATKPLIIHYRYFEPTDGHIRDFTNCHYFCGKVFADALQDCGVIENDNPKYLINETTDFGYVDKGEEPYIEIYLEEVNI